MNDLKIDQTAVITVMQKHPGQAFAKIKADFMQIVIKAALVQTGGNVKDAAKQLGISRDTMYVWMNKK